MKQEPSVIRTVRVDNELGLHARPATLIVKLLQDHASDVTFTFNTVTVDARSILKILILAAHKHAEIVITVTGPDAHQTMNRLEEGFKNRFGEKRSNG